MPCTARYWLTSVAYMCRHTHMTMYYLTYPATAVLQSKAL